MKDFFFHHYSPNNAVLVISGNITSDKAFILAEKWFGSIPEREIKNPVISPEPPQMEDRLVTVSRDVPIDTFYIGWHMGARKDKDFYVADLLSDILSSGNSSRIEEKLIKGQKLFVEADVFLSGENEPGLFIASGKVSDKVDYEFAQNALVKEILLTAEEKISDYELEKVKNKVEADLLFNEIGYLEKAMQLASFEILGDAGQINEQAIKYRDITADDILGVAKKIFRTGNRNTLNYKTIKKNNQ